MENAYWSGARTKTAYPQGAAKGEHGADPAVLYAIVDALRSESKDRMFYAYLLTAAPDDSDVEIIAKIREDELKHHDLFRRLYYELTGTYPQELPAMPFEQPLSYCEGLRNALFGEVTELTDYRGILAGLEQRRLIDMMAEIITDELRHIGLFNTLYAKNGCKV